MTLNLDEIEARANEVIGPFEYGRVLLYVREDNKNLIQAVRELGKIVIECAKHPMLTSRVDVSGSQTKIFWTDLSIKSRELVNKWGLK